MSLKQEQATINTYDRNAATWSMIHNYDLASNNFAGALTEFYGLVSDGSSVLEVGCGGGRDALELVKHYEYLGTDASAGMVESARNYVPAGEFQKCSVYDLGSLDKTFDAFWAAAILLHMPKDRIDEALQAIKSVTVSKAVGMIAIKDGDGEHFEIRQAEGMSEERLFTYWKDADFRAVLGRNAIDVISYKYIPLSQRTNWHIYLTRNRT